MKVGIPSILAFCLSSAAAVACSPAPNERAYSEKNGICGVTHFANEYGSEGLSDAIDLGKGFVSQLFYDGTACGYAHSQIVSDCSKAQAVVFGPSSYAGAMTEEEEAILASEPFAVLSASVESSAASAQHLSLVEIKELAKQARMINADIVSISGTVIGISNTTREPEHAYDFSCGCKHYYPNTAGANS